MYSSRTIEECANKRIFNSLRLLFVIIATNVLCFVLCLSYVLADPILPGRSDDTTVFTYKEDENSKDTITKDCENDNDGNKDNIIKEDEDSKNKDIDKIDKEDSNDNKDASIKDNENSNDGNNEKEKEPDIGNDKEAPNICLTDFSYESIFTDSASFTIKAYDNTDGIYIRYRCIMLTTEGEQKSVEDSTIKEPGRSYERSFIYSEEGAYDVTFYAYDDMGNASEIENVCFVIDTNAPSIEFEGFDFTKPSNKGANLTITVREIFYEGMNVDVRIFRDDEGSILEIPVGDFSFKAVTNRNVYRFDGDGTYHITVTAKDNAGHTTEKSVSFVIDSKPPTIDILFDGQYPRNEAVLDDIPKLCICIEDENYIGGAVSVSFFRKKGKSIYENISLEPKLLEAKKTILPIDIPGEGFYELNITAVDALNNTHNESLSFTIDMTAPAIGYLAEYNEKYLKSFNLPDDLSNYIDDLTGIRYKTYLNSKETGAGEIKKDGKYILQVVAIDEAGNSSEEMVAFIVDNKAPTVVLDGLNEDGNLEKDSPVKLSLKEEQDIFSCVYVNGEKLDLSMDKKTAELIPTEYGNYRIYVSARDHAGNVTTETITTNCERVFAAPLSNGPKEIEVKTLTKINSDSSVKMPKTFAIWGLCAGICAVAITLVIIAFLYEMTYTR